MNIPFGEPLDTALEDVEGYGHATKEFVMAQCAVDPTKEGRDGEFPPALTAADYVEVLQQVQGAINPQTAIDMAQEVIRILLSWTSHGDFEFAGVMGDESKMDGAPDILAFRISGQGLEKAIRAIETQSTALQTLAALSLQAQSAKTNFSS